MWPFERSMKTERVRLSDLRAFPNNPRVHPEAQIDELVKSIQQFGQYRPIVIDEANTILAGHGTVMALSKMGRSEGEAYRLTGLGDHEKRKLVLADNKISDLGEMDDSALLATLRALDGDLEIPGFDAEAVRDIVAVQELLDGDFEAPGEVSKEVSFTASQKTVTCPKCKHQFVPAKVRGKT